MTSSYDRERVLELCRTYGIGVKKGTGRVCLNGKEFDIKTIFENAIPSSILSLELSPTARIDDILIQEDDRPIQYTTRFSMENWTIMAA